MRTFNDPPTAAIIGDDLALGNLFSSRFDVGGVTPRADQFAHVRVVVSLVRTQMLLLARGWFRSLHRNALQGFLDQPHVMRVGTADDDAQRDAFAIGKQRPLGPGFSSIGGIGAGFFPLRAAPWSWFRRCFAIATGCLRVRCIPPRPAARFLRRSPWQPRAGSTDGGCFRSQTHAEPPSTDNWSATRRRYHRSPAAIPRVCGPDASAAVCGVAAADRGAPRGNRECANYRRCVDIPLP